MAEKNLLFLADTDHTETTCVCSINCPISCTVLSWAKLRTDARQPSSECILYGHVLLTSAMHHSICCHGQKRGRKSHMHNHREIGFQLTSYTSPVKFI